MNKRRMFQIGVLVAIFAAIGLYFYNEYRGGSSLPLNVSKAREFTSRAKEEGIQQVKITYRAPKTVEINCKNDAWTEEEVSKILTEIEEMLQDPEFQKEYAKKYKSRYKTVLEESYPDAVVVNFEEPKELLPTYSYSANLPFENWIRIGVFEENAETTETIQTEEQQRYQLLNAQTLEVEKDWSNYGRMEKETEDFLDENGNKRFYYELQCFYFDERYPEKLNEALQIYYDSVKAFFDHVSTLYEEETGEEADIPNNRLNFLYFTYLGEDYVSMVFEQVKYFRGDSVSSKNGIIIDCATGELVSAEQLIGDPEEEIGSQIKNLLGLEEYESSSFGNFLTEDSVVYFQRNSASDNCVAIKR